MPPTSLTKRLLCAGLLLVVLSSAAEARPDLAGQDDTAFREAVSRWLADDDSSLTTLAMLAREGNRAARLLLGRIEFTDRAPKAGLRALSRDGWLDLFRAPRGDSRFAPSWITTEARAGNTLAMLLKRATSLGLSPDAVFAIKAAGEPEATEHLIRKIAVDGSNAQRHDLLTRLGPDHELQPYVFGFRHAPAGLNTGATAFQRISGNAVIAFAAQRAQEILPQIANTFADHGYQGGDQLPLGWATTADGEAIANWVLNTRTAEPLASLCRSHCNDAELQACATTAFGLFGGYYEVIRLDSPLENLIAQSRFLYSARARGMTARRIANARTELGDLVFSETQLRNRSNCLADAVDPWRFPSAVD